jgi:hypothetical protein
MDLALALGRDIGSMSEREFQRWLVYTRRKSLPMRRIEFMLAQLCRLIAETMGGALNVTSAQYLIDPMRDERGYMIDPQSKEVEVDVEAMARDWM